MITIKNNVTKIKINTSRVKKNIRKMLNFVGYGDFDIGVWFTTNKTIRAYNKKYRKKDKPTDILSFPYHEDLKPGQDIVVHEPEDKNLGDIIISLEYVKRASTEQNCSLEQYVYQLLAHGVAHLLGYDHETDNAYRVMQKKEQQLLAAL